jgi:hypothetical protein
MIDLLFKRSDQSGSQCALDTSRGGAIRYDHARVIKLRLFWHFFRVVVSYPYDANRILNDAVQWRPDLTREFDENRYGYVLVYYSHLRDVNGIDLPVDLSRFKGVYSGVMEIYYAMSKGVKVKVCENGDVVWGHWTGKRHPYFITRNSEQKVKAHSLDHLEKMTAYDRGQYFEAIRNDSILHGNLREGDLSSLMGCYQTLKQS